MSRFSFTDSIRTIPLAKHRGVAAFDPVTLHLAAQKCANEVVSLALPTSLDARHPQAFTNLATLSVSQDSSGNITIIAAIDTGQMAWGPKNEPTEEVFTDYSGKLIEAVQLASISVAVNEGHRVAMIPMELPSGATVSAWFAQLNQESEYLDGLALVRQAQELMCIYHSDTNQYCAFVQVPRLRIAHESPINDSIECAEKLAVMQEFKAELDVRGARVRATTAIVATAAFSPNPQQPEVVQFGETGPVLWWLTEEESTLDMLPFAVFYTEASAWLVPSSVGKTHDIWA